MGIQPALVLPVKDHLSVLLCALCTNMVSLDGFVTTPCNHCFCRDCFDTWKSTLHANSKVCGCPKCEVSLLDDDDAVNLQVENIQDAQPLVYLMLCQIKVLCPCRNSSRMCYWTGDYGSLQHHIDTAHAKSSSDEAPSKPHLALESSSELQKVILPQGMELRAQSDHVRKHQKAKGGEQRSLSPRRHIEGRRMPFNDNVIRRQSLPSSSIDAPNVIDPRKECNATRHENDIISSHRSRSPFRYNIAERKAATAEMGSHASSFKVCMTEREKKPPNISHDLSPRRIDSSRSETSEEISKKPFKQMMISNPQLMDLLNQASVLKSNERENLRKKLPLTGSVTVSRSAPSKSVSLEKPRLRRNHSTDGARDKGAGRTYRKRHSIRKSTSDDTPHSDDSTNEVERGRPKELNDRSDESLPSGLLEELKNVPIEVKERASNSSFEAIETSLRRPASKSMEKKQPGRTASLSVRQLGSAPQAEHEDLGSRLELKRQERQQHKSSHSKRPVREHLYRLQRDDTMLTSSDALPNKYSDMVSSEEQEANAAYREGRYEFARNAYATAIAECPINDTNIELIARLHGNRAASSLKLHMMKDCIDDCDLALSLNKRLSRVYLRKSSALQGMGLFQEACTTLSEGLEYNPDIADLKKQLSFCQYLERTFTLVQSLLDEKKYSEADIVLSTAPSSTEHAKVLRCKTDLGLGNADKVLQTLNCKVWTKDMLDRNILELIAEANFQNGDLLQAIQYARNAETFSPDHRIQERLQTYLDVQSWMASGQAAMDESRFEEAALSYSSAIRICADRVQIKSVLLRNLLLLRSEAYLLAQDLPKCLNDTMRVISFERSSIKAWKIRVKAHSEMQRFDLITHELGSIVNQLEDSFLNDAYEHALKSSPAIAATAYEINGSMKKTSAQSA